MTNTIAGEQKTHAIKGNQQLRFHTLQTFQTKTDSDSGRTLYIGLFDANDVVQLGNHSNVRNFLKYDKDGFEKVNTGVHSKIYETLINRPEDFHLLNGGITVCAESLFGRDNDRKLISLKNASIINGAQTRGVIRKFLRDNPLFKNLLVKVEIVISQDQEFFDDISISRNQQNHVKAISISGKKGLLDELDKVTRESLKLDESQTDRFDTEKLVQLIFAVMPKEIWVDVFPKRRHWDKSVVYSSKATMFKKFSEISEFSKDSKVYKFFIDIADNVLDLYKHIQSNKPILTKFMDQGEFNKKGYRINSNKEVTILDGFIFPMMALCSHFIIMKEGKYQLPILSQDVYKSLAKAVVKYSGVNEHGNVQTLGKKSVSYAGANDMIVRLKKTGDLENFHKED